MLRCLWDLRVAGKRFRERWAQLWNQCLLRYLLTKRTTVTGYYFNELSIRTGLAVIHTHPFFLCFLSCGAEEPLLRLLILETLSVERCLVMAPLPACSSRCGDPCGPCALGASACYNQSNNQPMWLVTTYCPASCNGFCDISRKQTIGINKVKVVVRHVSRETDCCDMKRKMFKKHKCHSAELMSKGIVGRKYWWITLIDRQWSGNWDTR